ncbi:DDX47 [Cordylochernes scorpioides]|uniref:DDX47 n=1 Tax=Cordylochernes scorpioides TaxID=51811 RepID=A0ABY6LFJ6_9ARAC|nr:DDX47 [Cordylochernes scorpioides]
MLAGLPESYDGIIMTFSNVEDKEFTSSKVKHVLLAEYERRMARRVNNTNEALQFGTTTRKEDKKKKNFTCYKCGKEGHIARSCRGKAKTPAPNLQPPRCSTHEIAGSEMLTALSCAIPENSWVIDSSAIHHVCNKREWFTNFQGITSDPILRASGTTRAEGCGDIRFNAYVEPGSGKTGAFILPILMDIQRKDGLHYALVLEPTKELAVQVAVQFKNVGKYIDLKVVHLTGGDCYEQQALLLNKLRPRVSVATPGRLLHTI